MKTVLHIDLLSQEAAAPLGAVDRVIKTWFKPEWVPKTEHDEILLSTLAVIEGLAEGLRKAGVDDVVRFEVDGEVIFEDRDDEQGDLPFIVTQAIGAGLLDKPFATMTLQAACEVGGRRLDLVAKVAARVPAGDEELTIACSGPGIGPAAFRERVAVIGRAVAKQFGDAPWRSSEG